MENELEKSYGINTEKPEFEGEESLNPKNELSEIYPIKNINIDANYFSIFELKRKYDRTQQQNGDGYEYSNIDKRNQIILDSDFQREVVWGPKQKSELIESILMGLPIPVMYLFEDKSANLIVVDGRQRLTALFQFLNNDYELTGLTILRDLNKRKFKDIEPIYQSKLEDYQLITQVIKPPTPDAIKFQIFDRVNRGGTPLNNQEMRNALYQGNATKILSKLSKNNAFIEATQNGLKSKRMKDKYIILRAITFNLLMNNELLDRDGNLIEYKGNVDDFLGKTMAYLNFVSEDKLNGIEKQFLLAMKNSKRVLGEDAFRLIRGEGGRKSPINMNVFEVVVYIMIKLDQKKDLDDIVRGKYLELIQDNKFIENIANHRDSVNKVKERFEMINNKFKVVISDDRKNQD